MEHLKTYMDDLILDLNEVETEDQAEKISEKLYQISTGFTLLRAALVNIQPDDLGTNLDADFEHWEATALVEAKRAEAIIEEIRQEKEDEEQYGTYEEQVRDSYYEGVL